RAADARLCNRPILHGVTCALLSASFGHFGRQRVGRRSVGVRLQLEVLGQAPADGDLAASA
ncbi:MAG: hypothetical protein ACJ780_31255, partial [Solirubrobacteraceae bacterium]